MIYWGKGVYCKGEDRDFLFKHPFCQEEFHPRHDDNHRLLFEELRVHKPDIAWVTLSLLKPKYSCVQSEMHLHKPCNLMSVNSSLRNTLLTSLQIYTLGFRFSGNNLQPQWSKYSWTLVTLVVSLPKCRLPAATVPLGVFLFLLLGIYCFLNNNKKFRYRACVLKKIIQNY